ncbi:hypothetical protein C8R44DRAFT_919518 [Mycena epipterygia]|nr:hypothetical protein C8R44DRAFT_919518 [Mycena epipterygia]
MASVFFLVFAPEGVRNQGIVSGILPLYGRSPLDAIKFCSSNLNALEQHNPCRSASRRRYSMLMRVGILSLSSRASRRRGYSGDYQRRAFERNRAARRAKMFFFSITDVSPARSMDAYVVDSNPFSARYSTNHFGAAASSRMPALGCKFKVSRLKGHHTRHIRISFFFPTLAKKALPRELTSGDVVRGGDRVVGQTVKGKADPFDALLHAIDEGPTQI